MKHFLMILTLVILTFLCLPSLEAQITCTASVAPATCKRFDSEFGGEMSMWPRYAWTKRIEIVIAGPTQFKPERTKLDADRDAAVKSAKTVGDTNRIGSREAGSGVFGDDVILACPKSNIVQRIVISTDAIARSALNPSITDLSNELFFYVAGYDNGFMRRGANQAP
jgi:hypothetical protein